MLNHKLSGPALKRNQPALTRLKTRKTLRKMAILTSTIFSALLQFKRWDASALPTRMSHPVSAIICTVSASFTQSVPSHHTPPAHVRVSPPQLRHNPCSCRDG